jgi:iron-sulfur cluster repair protein YtfE (RIC family)
MNDHRVFDPKVPVRALLDRFHVARPVLASYGIDTCCGGEDPLEQACAARAMANAGDSQVSPC